MTWRRKAGGLKFGQLTSGMKEAERATPGDLTAVESRRHAGGLDGYQGSVRWCPGGRRKMQNRASERRLPFLVVVVAVEAGSRTTSTSEEAASDRGSPGTLGSAKPSCASWTVDDVQSSQGFTPTMRTEWRGMAGRGGVDRCRRLGIGIATELEVRLLCVEGALAID